MAIVAMEQPTLTKVTRIRCGGGSDDEALDDYIQQLLSTVPENDDASPDNDESPPPLQQESIDSDIDGTVEGGGTEEEDNSGETVDVESEAAVPDEPNSEDEDDDVSEEVQEPAATPEGLCDASEHVGDAVVAGGPVAVDVDPDGVSDDVTDVQGEEGETEDARENDQEDSEEKDEGSIENAGVDEVVAVAAAYGGDNEVTDLQEKEEHEDDKAKEPEQGPTYSAESSDAVEPRAVAIEASARECDDADAVPLDDVKQPEDEVNESQEEASGELSDTENPILGDEEAKAPQEGSEEEMGDGEVEEEDAEDRRAEEAEESETPLNEEMGERNKEYKAVIIDAVSLEESDRQEAAVAPPRPETPTKTAISPYRPNSIYRFLLYQGMIGRIVVMVLLLLTEWLQAYVPQLARFLGYLLSFVIPRERAGGDFRRTLPSTTLATLRTGKKQKRQLVRQADEVALRQLQRNKNRYRYVSDDFLRRHQLGPFSKLDAVVSKDAVAVTRIDSAEVLDSEGIETDWVLQALTRPRPNSKIQEQLSHDLNQKGLSVSVGAEVTVKVPAKTSNNESVMGRFMSAAGANSRVSRSLLGAYPGDATPIEKSASSEGVAWLASDRYGYGAWSDDELTYEEEMGPEDDEDEPQRFSPRKKPKHLSSRPRRRRRKRKTTALANTLTDVVGGSVGGARSGINSFRRSQRSPPEPPLFGSHTLRRNEGRSASKLSPAYRNVQKIRPATELLNELRSRKKKSNKDS